MSDNSTLSELGQEIIAIYSPSLINNYFILSVAVLMLYDYFLTLPLEVSYIWTGKLNFLKALFALNRYTGLVTLYSNLFLHLLEPESDTDCQFFVRTTGISGVLVTLAISCIFTLRTFAIYGRSWTVFYILTVPASAVVVSEIWLAVIQKALAFPRQLQIGPNACYNMTPSNLTTMLLVNTISSAVFDVLVMIFTVYRTARHIFRGSLKRIEIQSDLIFILLRDGILYYATIFMPSFVIIALDVIELFTSNFDVQATSGDLTYIVDALQIVLVNRLILNLVYTARAEESSETRTRTGNNTLAFSTNFSLGDIGGPVYTAQDDLSNDQFEPEARHEEELLDLSAEGMPHTRRKDLDSEHQQSPESVSATC